MQWCLDPATVGFDEPAAVHLESARHAGFALVEFPVTWLPALTTNGETVAGRFAAAGLTYAQFTCGFGTPGNLAVSEELFAARMSGAAEAWQPAIGAGCRRASLFFHTARHEGTPVDPAQAARRVAEVAAAFGQHGVRLSVGLVDPHLLAAAPEILAGSGAGLLVDTFSVFRAGLDAQWLRGLPEGLVSWFRVADAPAGRDRALLGYGDRLLPGAGVVPLPEMLAACRERGYHGPISVEVRDPALASVRPPQRAAAAMAALQEVFT